MFLKTPRLIAALVLTAFISNQAAQANPIISFVQQQQEHIFQKPHKLPPANFVRSHDYDVKHIALDLRFDWEKSQTYGTATLTVAPRLNEINKIALDAASMTINGVKTADGRALRFDYDEPKQTLTVMLGNNLKYGENATFVVDYRTIKTYGDGGIPGFGGGLKFITPKKNGADKKPQIWSQGESEYNRYWFPGYDSPNDFRTSELRATIEKPYTVVSNGKLIETKENKDGTRTFHWKMDVPYTNYLTNIIIGEYTEIKGDYAGIPVSSFMYPDEANAGKISISRVPQMVQLFSEKTKVKYPYNKYAQIMVQDMGGAMENITATTMTDTIVQDERSELDGDNDSIQAHELAHQWFGNYVTCREWSEIWLNESFATYLENVWAEKNLGRDQMLYQDVRANQRDYLNAWYADNRRPIVTKNYNDKDGLFDAYAYQRGGAVLHMLRVMLGDENFWRGLNYYLTTNANKPVSTEQLRIAFEESTGQSLDWFFDQWLYKMGHPIFEVTQNYDATTKKLTLNVKQTQKVDPNWDYPQAEFFRAPVDIEIGTAGNTRIERVLIEPKAENVFTFDAATKPLLVNFDYEGTLIKELKFDKSTDELIYQLQNGKDMLGRHSAMSQLAGRMKNEKTAANDKNKIQAALLTAIKNDSFWAIRRDAINQFAPPQQNQLEALFGGQSAFKPSPEIVAALKTAMKDKNSAVRATAINLLGSTGDQSLNADLTAALSDQSYNVVDSAANALGALKTASNYNRLIKLLDEPSWKNRVKIAGLNGLAATGDKRAFEVGLKYSDATNPANVRSAALGIVAATGKGDARAYPLVFDNFKKALDNNDLQSVFTGAVSIIRLADPRGQEAFDLLKVKYEKSAQIMGFVKILEAQFQQAIGKSANVR